MTPTIMEAAREGRVILIDLRKQDGETWHCVLHRAYPKRVILAKGDTPDAALSSADRKLAAAEADDAVAEEANSLFE